MTEAAAKRAKVVCNADSSIVEPIPENAMTQRVFKVQSLGGTGFEVSVPSKSTVEDLSSQVGSVGSCGVLFHLISEDGTMLDDPSGPLPSGSTMSVVKENPEPLCKAAQMVLNAAVWVQGNGRHENLALLHLGKCCCFGKFPTKEWKDDPRMADFMEYNNFELGEYNIYQLTLVDGAGKYKELIGVINTGDADCNSGFWGSVYLRPEFKEVGGIFSRGDSESKWEITDGSWYIAPSSALPQCENELTGGVNASTPLETHLAHALKIATGMV